MRAFAAIVAVGFSSLAHAGEPEDLFVKRALVGQVATVAIPSASKAPELAGIAALMQEKVTVVIDFGHEVEREEREGIVFRTALVDLTLALADREQDFKLFLQGKLDESRLSEAIKESKTPIGLLAAGTRIRIEEFKPNGLFVSVITALDGEWSAEAPESAPKLLIDSCYLKFEKAEAQLAYLRNILPKRRCNR